MLSKLVPPVDALVSGASKPSQPPSTGALMAIASPQPESTPNGASTTVQLPGGGSIHICINVYGGAPAATTGKGTGAADASEIHPGEYGFRYWKVMDGQSGNTNVLGSFVVVSATANVPFFGLSPGHDHWSFNDVKFLEIADSFRMVPQTTGEPAQFTPWRKQLEGTFTAPGAFPALGEGVSLFRASKGKFPQTVDAWLHYQHTQDLDTLTWLAAPTMVGPDGYLKLGPNEELRWDRTLVVPNFPVLRIGGALT